MKKDNFEKEINIEDLDTPKVNAGDVENSESEFVELGVDGEELSGKDITKKLRERIKKLETEKQDYLNSWQRALADYKNREMQIEKEKKEWGGYAVKRFAEELLVVMDTYDAAKSNKAAWEAVDQNWRIGIEYIFMTFESKLAEQGFEKFGKVGEIYNPELHEALATLEINSEDQSVANIKNSIQNNGSEIKESSIAQVIMSGYNYNGKLFRAAKVKVWG